MKITSQLRSNPDFVLLATVMNLFVLAEITTKSYSQQYISTVDCGKSVCSLIQPNLGTNWFERLLDMPIVRMNYALRQFTLYTTCRANTSYWIQAF